MYHNSHSDPTAFGWSSYDGSVSIAGKETAKHGGWAAGTLKMGDVSVIKLEAEQLSVRVQRVGDRTFTVPTNGQRGLRVWVCLHTGGRVRLSAAEPHEEFIHSFRHKHTGATHSQRGGWPWPWRRRLNKPFNTINHYLTTIHQFSMENHIIF